MENLLSKLNFSKSVTATNVIPTSAPTSSPKAGVAVAPFVAPAKMKLEVIEPNPRPERNAKDMPANSRPTDAADAPQSCEAEAGAKQPVIIAADKSIVTRPNHPFRARDVVWCSRREYEGENADPLEHLHDVTNHPACVFDAVVPGRPECVYICGVGLRSFFYLRPGL